MGWRLEYNVDKAEYPFHFCNDEKRAAGNPNWRTVLYGLTDDEMHSLNKWLSTEHAEHLVKERNIKALGLFVQQWYSWFKSRKK